MKGLLIQEKIFESRRDLINGDSSQQLRIVVPGASNLTIMDDHGLLRAIIKDEVPSDNNILREIDVPDELVLKAQQFVRAQIGLNEMKNVFDSLAQKDKK